MRIQTTRDQDLEREGEFGETVQEMRTSFALFIGLETSRRAMVEHVSHRGMHPNNILNSFS